VGIGHALADHAPDDVENFGFGPGMSGWGILNNMLMVILSRQWRVPGFTHSDLRQEFGALSDGQMIDVVEAWFPAMAQIADRVDASTGVYYGAGSGPGYQRLRQVVGGYRSTVNDIFDDEEAAWQLVGEFVVPRESMAMHSTIVEPVFTLTAGDRRLGAVEAAFQKALLELKPGGDPSDAITDAGTALQQMLEVAGAHGNALGALLTDAKKRGLLGPYDSKLADGIAAIGDWVSADRSTRGDAHNVREASREDAWLAVRVAGALILRLAAGENR
jgi:hypothetical protein